MQLNSVISFLILYFVANIQEYLNLTVNNVVSYLLWVFVVLCGIILSAYPNMIFIN